MPGDQLMPFLHQLYDGLTDPHDQSSSGVCVVLNDVVKARGAALPAEVRGICGSRYLFSAIKYYFL